MKKQWGISSLRYGAKALLTLCTAGSLLLSACNVDPGQLSGTALGDSIFLPIVSGPVSETTQTAPTANGAIIPDRYIVVLSDEQVAAASVSAVAAEMTAAYGGTVVMDYASALTGFVAQFPAETSAAAAAALQQDQRVAYVEPDRVVTLDPLEVISGTVVEGAPTTTDEVGAAAVETVQTGATWGLDRIDQRGLPLDTKYSFSYAQAVTDTFVYIIDSGIRITHTDFGGRATWGTNTRGDGIDTDCDGHGTHVAGTVGGAQYGVAKTANLIAVKVIDCTGGGSVASVLAGIDWVTSQKEDNPTLPMVANMSLGLEMAGQVWDDAVRNSITAGVVYVLAAGNANKDACSTSPARTAEAITVGATRIIVSANTPSDARASFSNYGACVDLFAPGDNIVSLSHTSDTGTVAFSGTSMAAPHVAGAVANYLRSNPTATPSEVGEALATVATKESVSDAGAESPNALLHLSPQPDLTFAPSVSIITNKYTVATGWAINVNPRLLGDVNGDNQADIVGFADDGVYLSLRTAGGFPTASKVLNHFALVAGGWTQNHPRALGDVDGDGKADIVGFGENGVYVAFSTGTGFQAPRFTIPNFGSNASVGGWTLANPRTVGDVNGDGKADLIGFAGDGVDVAFSTGSSFQPPIKTVADFGVSAGGWTQDHPRTVGDVNGDGKVDIVGFGDEHVYVSFSTGTGFGTSQFMLSGFAIHNGGWSATKHPRRVVDVNGDGKADIVGFGDSAVMVSLSTGTRFQTPFSTIKGYTVNGGGWTANHLRLLDDVDGDGKADIVGFGQSTVYLSTAIIR